MVTYKRHKLKKYGPCKIIKKINDNAYIIEILEIMAISCTFHVRDIYGYVAKI